MASMASMGLGCGRRVRKGARENARARRQERGEEVARTCRPIIPRVELAKLNSQRLDPLHVDGTMVGSVSKCVHARPEFRASR